jgi:hypothetical protein
VGDLKMASSIENRRLSILDEKDLKSERGFTNETIKALNLFSVTESDLPTIGVTIPFKQLPSTLCIPYLNSSNGNGTICRVHKNSAAGQIYPPYLTPKPKTDSFSLGIPESELKAAMVYQLGDLGMGLQGSGSYLNRVHDLAKATYPHTKNINGIYILPDLEYLLEDNKKIPHPAMGQMIKIAVRLGTHLGKPVKVILLPEKYLKPGTTKAGAPKLKCDLDGCVAAGMTEKDWIRLKAEAVEPPSLPLPLPFLIGAIASADLDSFFKSTTCKARIALSSAEEKAEICHALSNQIAKNCFNEDNGFDVVKQNLLIEAAMGWFKNNGIKGLKKSDFISATKGAGEDQELIAHCLRETPCGVDLIKKGQAVEKVSNFTLRSVQYGLVYFLGHSTRRRYEVKIDSCVQNSNPDETLTIYDDLYNSENYTRACPDLIVPRKNYFQMLVASKLTEADFQQHNPALDKPLFVGICKNDNKFISSLNVKFPRNDLDCWYADCKFPSEGDANASFQEIASITADNDVAFSHILGSPLKCMLGSYPHGALVGSRYSGKTQTAIEIKARTNFDMVSADLQLTSRYRQLRAFGNHNLPILVDEAHRLEPISRRSVLEFLNSSYTGVACSHGTDGHYYLSGCGILIGQDRPVMDEALNTKNVTIYFDEKKLNLTALRKAKKHRTTFPIPRWFSFLVEQNAYLQSLHNDKFLWLNEKLQSDLRENNHRNIFNYASVLVAAKLLKDFGVSVSIDDKIVRLCELHCQGRLHADDVAPASTSAAEEFLRAALEIISLQQHRQQLLGAFDIDPTRGVWLRLTPIFEYLKRLHPDRYDFNRPERMGEAINNEYAPKGMKRQKRTFGSIRKEAWFLPIALCNEFGIELINESEVKNDPSKID